MIDAQTRAILDERDRLWQKREKLAAKANSMSAQEAYDRFNEWQAENNEVRRRLRNRLLVEEVEGQFRIHKEEFLKNDRGEYDRVWITVPPDGLPAAEYSKERIEEALDDLKDLYSGDIIHDQNVVKMLLRTGKRKLRQITFTF